MMKRRSLLLALAALLASPAGALKMSIWDREMQTTVGAGESSGNRFNVQLVRSYSGPVVVIFSQTDEEKRSGAFQGLQNRYDGVMKNGQLTLTLLPPAPVPDRSDDRPDPKAPAPASLVAGAIPTSVTPFPPPNRASGITLGKLLQQFKLSVTVQTTGQNFTPGEGGFRTAESSAGNGNAGNTSGSGNLRPADRNR